MTQPADRTTRRRRIWMWAPAGALLLALAPACKSLTSTSTSAPATKGTAATTSTTAASKGIVLKVTGSGGTANSITVLDGSQEHQANSTALPWTQTLTDNPSIVGVTAQSGDSSTTGTITCEIDAPGKKPVTNTSTGTDAVVSCNGTPGF